MAEEEEVFGFEDGELAAALPTNVETAQTPSQPEDEDSKDPGKNEATNAAAAPHSDALADDVSSSEDEGEAPTMLSERPLLKLGWLKKRGGGRNAGRHAGKLFARRSWKTRWFVLRDNILMYFRQQTITGAGKCLGWIDLTDDASINSNVHSPKGFFIHTPKRPYQFEAETENEAAEWVRAIQGVLNSTELS